MGGRVAFVVAALLGPLLLGSSHSARAQSLRLPPVFFEAYNLVLFGSDQDCTTSCDVTITLSTIQVDSKEYCVASLPGSLKFHNTLGYNPEKTITWKLSASSVGGLPVEFHLEHGILKVDDDDNKKQFTPDNIRTDKTTFKAKNKHRQKTIETYVPVILRRAEGGVPELCAVGDPKIVND